MTKRYLLITALLITCAFARPDAQRNTTRYYLAFDHETVTVSDSVSIFTADKINPGGGSINRAELVTFSIACNGGGTTCPMRFTLDGTAPTTSAGTRVDYGQIVSIYNYDNISNFKSIREGATSALIDCQYFR